jgi:hypothetical protein
MFKKGPSPFFAHLELKLGILIDLYSCIPEIVLGFGEIPKRIAQDAACGRD